MAWGEGWELKSTQPGFDYRKHLNRASGSDDLKAVIENSTLTLIGNHQELAARGIEASRAENQQLSETFEQAISSSVTSQTESLKAELSLMTDRFGDGFSELSTVIDRGLSDVELATRQVGRSVDNVSHILTGLKTQLDYRLADVVRNLGSLNRSLEDLLVIAKTPTQTWATEQFDVARTSLQRGLYEDALDYVGRAIAGHGSQTGYKIDHRFHQLEGVIRLGDSNPESADTADLDLSYSAFEKAERYARKVDERDRANILALMGYNRLMAGLPEQARAHLEKAISIDPFHAVAYFHRTKSLIATKQFDEALTSLSTAIIINPETSLLASSDEDFSTRAEGQTLLASAAHRAHAYLTDMSDDWVKAHESTAPQIISTLEGIGLTPKIADEILPTPKTLIALHAYIIGDANRTRLISSGELDERHLDEFKTSSITTHDQKTFELKHTLDTDVSEKEAEVKRLENRIQRRTENDTGPTIGTVNTWRNRLGYDTGLHIYAWGWVILTLVNIFTTDTSNWWILATPFNIILGYIIGAALAGVGLIIGTIIDQATTKNEQAESDERFEQTRQTELSELAAELRDAEDALASSLSGRDRTLSERRDSRIALFETATNQQEIVQTALSHLKSISSPLDDWKNIVRTRRTKLIS